MTSAGSIRGQIRISARQAIAEYAAVRAANAATRTALLTSSAAFAKVGVVALAAAAPIALLFKSAITEAAQFQKKIDYFGAVTNATQADMTAVAKKAMDMSKTTIYSASQMADSFVEFGKAGISTKAILNGVADATVNLAQAADISMGDASNIMASQLATFKFGAKEAGHVADTLAGAANASIIDVSDLAYSLRYAGGIAASTGITFTSLVDAISLLGKRGIKGSQAGTSLRMIMVSLLGTTKTATKELMKLGIITKKGTNHFIDQHGHIKQLAQVFDILRKAEHGMTEAQQLQANKMIFNTRALSAVQILMRDGAKGFTQMQQQISKVTASDVAHKRLDNLAGDFTRLKNNIKTMLIQAGGPLQNFFRRIVQGLLFLVRGFGNLSTTQQKFIVYGLGIVGAFLAWIGVMSLTISMVLKVISVYKDLKIAFILIRTYIMKTLIPAFRAMFVALATNPVLLIIVAIVALAAAFYYAWTHFKGFRDFIKRAWADIKGFFIAAWHVIDKVFHQIVNAGKTAWDLLYKYWIGPNITVVKTIIGAYIAVFNFLRNAFITIVNFIKAHWRDIITIIGAILGPVALIIALLVDIISKHWTAISQFLIKTWHVIVAAARIAWNLLKEYISIQVRAIRDVIQVAWTVIKAVTGAVWAAIKAVVVPYVHAILAVIRFVFGAARRYVEFEWNAIGTVIRVVYHSVIQPIIAAFKRLINGIKPIIHEFVRIWDAAWSAVGDAITTIYNTIVRPIVDLIKSALGELEGLLHKIGDIAGKIGGAIGKVTHGAGSVLGHVGSFLGLDSGGWVPGKKGQMASNVRVHGGEYVLSTAMLNGQKRVDPKVMAALSAAKGRAMAGHGNVGINPAHAGAGTVTIKTPNRMKVVDGTVEISPDSQGRLRGWVKDLIVEEHDFHASLGGMR